MFTLISPSKTLQDFGFPWTCFPFLHYYSFFIFFNLFFFPFLRAYLRRMILLLPGWHHFCFHSESDMLFCLRKRSLSDAFFQRHCFYLWWVFLVVVWGLFSFGVFFCFLDTFFVFFWLLFVKKIPNKQPCFTRLSGGFNFTFVCECGKGFSSVFVLRF